MSLRNRKTTTDPLSPHESTLLQHINSQPDTLVLFAQYFANSRLAARATVTEVDSAGLTLQYVDKNMEGQLAQKEIRIQFDGPVRDVESAKRKIDALGKEAKDAMGMKADKTYKPPRANTDPRLTSPGVAPYAVAIMVVGWTLLFIGAFVDEIPASLENIRQELGGAVLFERAAMGIVILHGLETLVAVGFAVYGRFPAVDYLVAIVYVMVFGIKSLGATINVATRRRALLA